MSDEFRSIFQQVYTFPENIVSVEIPKSVYPNHLPLRRCLPRKSECDVEELLEIQLPGPVFAKHHTNASRKRIDSHFLQFQKLLDANLQIVSVTNALQVLH